jgi:hypothetical protein
MQPLLKCWTSSTLRTRLWFVNALNSVRQSSIFYKEDMRPILGNITTLTVESLNNPRTALCKTVIMASYELIKVYQDQMIDFIDPMLFQFL